MSTQTDQSNNNEFTGTGEVINATTVVDMTNVDINTSVDVTEKASSSPVPKSTHSGHKHHNHGKKSNVQSSGTPKAPDTTVELNEDMIADDPLSSKQLKDALAILATLPEPEPNVIAVAQQSLYNALTRVLLRKPDEIVFPFLDKLLVYIHANKNGHFSDTMVFRWLDKAPSMGTAKLKEFTMLFFILMDVANPTTRGQVLKNMKWDNVRNELRPDTADHIVSLLRRYFNID